MIIVFCVFKWKKECFILFLPIDVGLGDMGVKVGLISCHIHEAFLLLKNTCFLRFKPVIFCLFPPLSFYYFHLSVLCPARPWFKTMFPWPRGHFFQHYGALLSPWHCAVSQCDRTTVNLPLYMVATYILQTPSFCLYHSSLCVCFSGRRSLSLSWHIWAHGWCNELWKIVTCVCQSDSFRLISVRLYHWMLNTIYLFLIYLNFKKDKWVLNTISLFFLD